MVRRSQDSSLRISSVVLATGGTALVAVCVWLVLTWAPALSGDPAPAEAGTGPSAGAGAPSTALPATAPKTQGAPVTATRLPALPSLAVIGDSFTTGTSGDIAGTWPDLLCQRVGCQYLPRFAVPSTGYTVPGADGLTVGGRLQSVIDEQPDVVVIAAGAFDRLAPKATLIGNVNQTLYRLQRRAPNTRIVVLSPFWLTAPAPARLIKVRGWIYDASIKHGVTFVNVTDLFDASHPDLMETSGTAPDQGRQQYVADTLEPVVRSVLPAAPTQ